MTARSILLASALGLVACGGGGKKETTSTTTTTQPSGKSLYDRLGGVDAIKAVVKDFVEEQVAKDPRINARFANTDIPKLEEHLTNQICQATGGPFHYTGKALHDAHAALHITSEEFDEVGAEIGRALDHFRVPEREKQEVLAAIVAKKAEVVTPAP